MIFVDRCVYSLSIHRKLTYMNVFMPSKVYRVLNVNGPEHVAYKAKGTITARCPLESCSVREHLIHGSGSNWKGLYNIN